MPPVTFYDAQARHRRAASRWAMICAAAAAILAVAASVAITPVVMLLTIAAARLIDLVVPLPSAWDFARTAVASLDLGMRDVTAGRWQSPEVMRALQWLGAVLLPGILIVLAWWRLLRARARREDSSRLLRELDARAADHSAFEERQLSNVAEETAIAAGALAPRVFVTAHDGPAAATAGVHAVNASIVFTAPALIALDRDQTQAVVAHAIAAFVNADHRLHVEASAVARIHESIAYALGWPLRVRGWIVALLSPAAAVMLAIRFFLAATTLFLVVPMVGMMLRHRRLLADATAVQLTRNPDALARALVALDPLSRIDQGGHWAPQHFVAAPAFKGMGTPLPLIGAQPPIALRLARLREMGATVTMPAPAAAHAVTRVNLAPGAMLVTILSPLLVYLASVAVLVLGGAAAGAYWLAFWAASRLIP